MAAPNLLGITTVTGKSAVLAVTTTPTDIVANAAASGTVVKINSLIVSNVDGENVADVTVSLLRSGTEYNITSTVTVPADASLVAISKETSIYLEENDSLRLTASADGDLEAVCSYEIIS